MGLDNGIIVRGKKRADMPNEMYFTDDPNYFDGVEICYWRKCWGLRGKFLREAYPHSNIDEYHFEMKEREINILINILEHYLICPKDWNDSIWEFDKIKPILEYQTQNLKLLLDWYKEHPDAYIYFYDSY